MCLAPSCRSYKDSRFYERGQHCAQAHRKYHLLPLCGGGVILAQIELEHFILLAEFEYHTHYSAKHLHECRHFQFLPEKAIQGKIILNPKK